MCNCIRVDTRGHMGTRITQTTTKLTDRLTDVMTDLMADDVMKVSRAPILRAPNFRVVLASKNGAQVGGNVHGTAVPRHTIIESATFTGSATYITRPRYTSTGPPTSRRNITRSTTHKPTAACAKFASAASTFATKR
jgi:hypothetical protein